MSDISQSNELNIRQILIDLALEIPDKDVAVFLSAGVDSQSICFSLLEAEKNVTAYSFTLNDRESRDFLMAKHISNIFNIKFIPILLPVDISTLKADVLTLHKKYGCNKKTEYECTWPFLYSYPKVVQTVCANGIGSDGHFCLSKKGVLHYKDNIDEYRKQYWNRKNGGEYNQHRQLAKEFDKIVFEPFRDKRIIEYFNGTSWYDVNTPKQKQPILNSFPEYFKKFKVYPHTNFQLGDSGIAEHFEKLLQTDWNIHNYKSVVGVFNTINRGELNGRRKLI